MISQSVVSESVTNLYTCDIIFPLQQSQALSKLELAVFETAEVDIIRSFSAPEFNIPNNLYHAKPFTAHVQPTQCFTYLQRAEPSSYKKRLVNSFAVSEQLSPTAESHARHIADSLPLGITHEGRVEVMPQPWLSADLLDDNTPEGISLMIPEPLTPCRGVQSSLHSITEADETQIMMDEDSTMSRKKRPCKKAASFSLTQGIAREKVDELITQYNSDISSQPVSQGKPSAGLFSNLLSKIGGRRILMRPQESPPRARRSLSNPSPSSDRPAFVRGSTVIQRRKSSPSIRARDSQARNRLAKFIITISNAHSSKQDFYCKLSYPAHLVHNSQLRYSPSLFWRKPSSKWQMKLMWGYCVIFVEIVFICICSPLHHSSQLLTFVFSSTIFLHISSPKQADQTLPKHKPVVRDDSPIRNKEAYYGGPHYHTPVREPCVQYSSTQSMGVYSMVSRAGLAEDANWCLAV